MDIVQITRLKQYSHFQVMQIVIDRFSCHHTISGNPTQPIAEIAFTPIQYARGRTLDRVYAVHRVHVVAIPQLAAHSTHEILLRKL